MINEIRIENHEIFGDINVVLSDKAKLKNENHFTLILGENGTGKSELLKSILDSVVFMEVNDEAKRKRIKKNCKLNYEVNGLSNYTPPDYIISSASTLNDKFPIKISASKYDEDRYKYLGIRSANNNAFVGKYRIVFFNSFKKIIEDNKRLSVLKTALIYYGFPLRFSFRFSLSKLAAPLKTYSDLMGDYQSFVKTATQVFTKATFSNNMARGKIIPIINDDRVMRAVYKSFNLLFNKEKQYELQLNVDDVNSCCEYISISEDINELVKYGLVTVEEFSIISSRSYGFKNASSGQFNLFSSLLTLSAEIMDNTLLLIDEPEVSLHPKWQVMYISAVRRIVDEFKDCQVVIATHSHLLVSNMPLENSSVLVSKRDSDGYISFNELSSTPAGWSAESILYNVFGIITSRNSAFSLDLNIMAGVMSNWDDSPDTLNKFKDALERIKRFDLPENDPLKNFSEKAEEFLRSKLNA
ncbi:ATP-binding protein [Serratia fonticola]|uniref:ATP-binding protein n=1 Tax=Serratia fonticola TaxID=47917 RepID=UPI00217A97E6|nr:ATP-binding protein [Serratia fonticola]CAI1013413.1 Predicted ATP-binding protein involved in virulence [Serratia fonticola]